MREYIVTFAGFTVSIGYYSDEVKGFLHFLFDDLSHDRGNGDYDQILIISENDDGQHTLTNDNEMLFQGPLGVNFAAVLFDSVIFNLLNMNKSGVALHAGAVVYREKVIFIPGQSGSGKSTMTAWLTAHGFAYLTDELIFLPDDGSGQTMSFSRPVCIKSAAVSVIKKLLRKDTHRDILQDDQGVIVPHRSLNSDFSIVTSPPSLLLFPSYQNVSSLNIEKISGAQACTYLMSCDVNARNLLDHGFKQIVKIAQSTPAYKVSYGCFQGFGDAFARLFDELNWG